MSVPVIVDSYPANSAQGIVLGDRIIILFDQEMDESSIDAGSLVLIGPTKDFIFGRDFTPLDVPGIEDEQILNSPYTGAYVEGVYSFERINPSSLSVIDIQDTTGARNLYRTRVTFTPSKPLSPGVTYTVLLAGDEDLTDGFDIGARSRSVFDTVFTGSGTGRLNFDGTYTGTVSTTYKIEITSGGAAGAAEYIWWDENDPLTTFPGITSTGRREIAKGVWITCEPDGTFTTGDTFSAVCKPPELVSGNVSWSFATGSGSISTPPSTSSTTGITNITSTTGTSTGTSFGVSSVVPANRAHDIATTTTAITITFTEAPDPATIITNNFSLASEPVNGDTTLSYTGDLTFTASVTDKVVTLTLAASQLYENNLVKCIISSNVKNASGTSLSEYSWYFTTTYSPMYTSIRRVRLDMGGLISSVPNDTVQLAIFEASRYVDAVSFTTTAATGAGSYLLFAKRELATCYAELILTNVQALGSSEDMRKTLGDLTVSRGKGFVDDNEDKLEQCMARWEAVVQTGGAVAADTSQKPVSSVKGSTAEDRIGVGREWEPTSVVGSETPAGNAYYQATARRWTRRYRKRR